VKLADFGIARSMVGRRRGVLATKDTTAGARKGRASYLAPEIVSGRRQVIDHRVDLYGLGATLWCALCGTPPYVADDDVALVDAIVRGAVPLLREHIGDEADDELASVVASLLAKDPEARPTNAAVVARALRQWLEARSVDGTAIVADAVRALGLPSLATAT